MAEQLKVMIAEDDENMRIILEMILERLGHQLVAAAEDGLSAVKLAREVQPDLLIMDIQMPAMNGLQALEQILTGMSLPVILSSGRSDPEAVQAARDLHVQAYLVKPFTEEQLRVAISIALEQHQRYQSAQNRIDDLLQQREHAGDELIRLREQPQLRKAKAAGSGEDLEKLGLTHREAEVLLWVARGKSNNEVAAITNMSRRTVEKHMERILKKLRVSSRTAAALKAIEALGGAPME